jgi:hypothetical protein
MDEMWEFMKITSHGGKSIRRTIYFALATIVATFLMAIITTSNSLAVDATWSTTSSIKYGADSYNGPANENTVNNLKLPKASKAYTYIDPEVTAQDNSGKIRKIHVIYLAPDANLSVSNGAKYVEYTYVSTSNFTNPSATKDITIEPQPAGLTNPGTTSCDSSVTYSLGWIVCPVTNFLAGGMDWIFNTVISSFLTVRPVQTNTDNALFRAWSYMRSFANVAFVIAFLIIIYSQLTSFGISNYGIKTLMPRLIIAAILVNLSYYVCAIAIDISNIAGYGVQDIFINIRNSLVGTEGNSWDVLSAKSITGFVLSGGTAVVAGTMGLVSTLSTYGVAGSLFLLLPSLVIALMAILVALLIMAARQAIITILVIIAPLAFVAYLLPNTEKWFEKWKSTMLTMLILFPAFSLVFGGAQLASAVIIQNADSINVIILALLIQVAPLMITPLLINLSGSILGKIAGIANDLNKNPIDKVRKYTDDRSANRAARRLAEMPKKWQILRRNAQYSDRKRRLREGWKKTHETMADNNFHESMTENSPFNKKLSHKSHEMHMASYKADTNKQKIEHILEKELKDKIRTTPSLLKTEMEVRVLADEVGVSKARLDKVQEDLRAGVDSSVSRSLGAFVTRSTIATRDLQLNSIANNTAKRVQQAKLADLLLKNAESIDGKLLRDYAGGTDKENGADSVLANAVHTYGEVASKVVAERTALASYFKLTGGDRQLVIEGTNFRASDIHGNKYTFDANDENTLEALINVQMKTGALNELEYMIMESGDNRRLHKFRTDISNAIVANGLASKASYFGGAFANDVAKGVVAGKDGLDLGAAKSIVQGKFKPEGLAANDPNAIKRYLRVAQMSQADIQRIDPDHEVDFVEFQKNIEAFKHAAEEVLDPTTTTGRAASQATKDELQKVIDQL